MISFDDSLFLCFNANVLYIQEITMSLKAKIAFLIFVRYYLFCLPFLAYNLTVIEDFYAIKIMLPKRNVILFISPSKVIVGIL